MASFIRCPECSFTIGKYSEFVNLAKESIIKENVYENKKYKDVSPDKMFFNPKIVPSIEIIFDSLDIKNRCCRMHIINKTDMTIGD